MLWGGRILSPQSSIYHDAAQVHGLELAMVLAIAEHESSFRQAAYNPEPKWVYFWNVKDWRPWRVPAQAEIASEVPPDDFPGPPSPVPRDAEWWGQQASWGPMQVMGAVARELGCRALYLAELAADPIMGVDLGCRFLARQMKRYHGDIPSAFAAFNAGSARRRTDGSFHNQEYVDVTLEGLRRYRNRIPK